MRSTHTIGEEQQLYWRVHSVSHATSWWNANETTTRCHCRSRYQHAASYWIFRRLQMRRREWKVAEKLKHFCHFCVCEWEIENFAWFHFTHFCRVWFWAVGVGQCENKCGLPTVETHTSSSMSNRIFHLNRLQAISATSWKIYLPHDASSSSPIPCSSITTCSLYTISLRKSEIQYWVCSLDCLKHGTTFCHFLPCCRRQHATSSLFLLFKSGWISQWLKLIRFWSLEVTERDVDGRARW